MSSPLERLRDLTVEAPDAREFDRLKKSGATRLPDALGLGPEVWRVLAKCHEMRNASEYHGEFEADERLVADLITACEAVEARVNALPPLP